MSTVLLVGDAQGVLDIQTTAVTAYDAATTYKFTINGKTVSVLGSGGTTTTVATALAAALEASTIPEFAEFDWTSNAANVIATANESSPKGKTHTITTSVSGGTGTIGSPAATQAPKGSESLTAENCKTTAAARALPANSDIFYVGQLASDLLYNLDALAAITGLVVHFQASFTGECGLPFSNTDNTSYNEYRARYFKTDGGTFYIGLGEGDGSGRLHIDPQGSEAHFYVYLTAESEDDGQHALVIKGTHANNTLTAFGGTIDVAPQAGETATLATLTATGSAIVRTSTGVTLGDVIVENAAVVTINSPTALANISSIEVQGSATLYLLGDNTVDSLVLDGTAPKAYLKPNAALTITACTLGAGAILDLDNSPNLVTITTLTVSGECTINDRNGQFKSPNPVPGFYAKVTYNGPPGRSWTLEDP